MLWRVENSMTLANLWNMNGIPLRMTSSLEAFQNLPRVHNDSRIRKSISWVIPQQTSESHQQLATALSRADRGGFKITQGVSRKLGVKPAGVGRIGYAEYGSHFDPAVWLAILQADRDPWFANQAKMDKPQNQQMLSIWRFVMVCHYRVPCCFMDFNGF